MGHERDIRVKSTAIDKAGTTASRRSPLSRIAQILRAAVYPLLGVAAIAVAALVWMPGTALADYEQVPEHFGESGEAAQLVNALGAAVNSSGAGGVAAGSLYVVGKNARVVRFAPGGEGEEPQFEEAWGWGVGNHAEEFQRCGPAYADTADEEHTFKHCKMTSGYAEAGGDEIGHFEEPGGVAVDQATGDVYVRNSAGLLGTGERRHRLIEVFTATGTPVGEGFGDAADESTTPPQSIAETPEKLHFAQVEESSIAVDEAGTVYLNDSDYPGVEPLRARVMSFKPCTAEDYESYCYTGQGNDIAIPLGQEPGRIALAGGGRLAAGRQDALREYELEGGALICSLPIAGQLKAMTANPATGEVFYYTFSDRSIHRLGPCDAETGEFEELQAAVKPAPEARKIRALAINPTRAWGPERPAGTLYAVNGEYLVPENAIGDVLAPAKLLGPAVLSESVAATGTTSTVLRAEVDPKGSPTTYSFQYLPRATYQARREAAEGEGEDPEEAQETAFAGAPEAPPGGGLLPSGALGTATAAVSGLFPDTAYAFRATAESHCAGPLQPPCPPTFGQAAFFATFAPASAAPPDGRAYELVSPAQKHGGEVFPADASVNSCDFDCKPSGVSNSAVFPMRSAPGGEAVAYEGYAFSPSEGASVFNSYLSRRTATGWQTTAMSPALLATKGGLHLAYSPTLGAETIFQPSPPLAAAAPSSYSDIYMQSAAAPGTLTPLLTSPPPHRGPGGLLLEYAGASPDFTRQFFAANDSLIGAGPYAPAPPDPTSSGRDLYEWHGGQLALLNVLPGNSTIAAMPSFASASPDAHAIAAGGAKVFWRAGGHLYVRIDGARTLEVASGDFLTANAEGTRVLLGDGRLLALNGAGTAYQQLANLTGGAGGFLGVAGASGDLSKIYFLDTAALPGSGHNERGEEAQGGEDNLYLYEAGAGARFVATLAATDGSGGESLQDWAASPAARTAEASPSGRFLAFGSTRPLSGYDNVGPCGIGLVNEVVQAPCREAFLYDSVTGHLTCPSCNPSGEAPLGPSTLRRIGGAGAWQPQPRYLTDQGRLYFDSQDRLSPLDVNGKVEDVYEAEPQGVGSCQRPGGCVSLVSPGTGTVDSNLLAIDETGANVFFTSREALVAADTDELIDLYDAREGGGFPGESETQRSECLGEACQAAPSAPEEVTPASAGLAPLAGNLLEPAPRPAPRRCARGKVRRKGRCVARHPKHRKRKRAMHRHGGARR
jgi:hypothetical protein